MNRQGGVLPFSSIGTVDDLLDRARVGALARTGLEAVKATLQRMRDLKYRQMLDAPDDQALRLRAELRAIELLAQDLLAKEVQGTIATRQLYARAGLAEEPGASDRASRGAPRKRSKRPAGRPGSA